MENTRPVIQPASQFSQLVYAPWQAAASVLSKIQLFQQVLQNRQDISLGQQVDLRDQGGKKLGDLSIDLIRCITDYMHPRDFQALRCIKGFHHLEPGTQVLWRPSLQDLKIIMEPDQPIGSHYRRVQLPLDIDDKFLHQFIAKGNLNACEFLDISKCNKLSDTCLKPLSGLPNLTALKAAFSNIKFMNVAAGTSFRLLKSFDFNNSQCCESGVERIFKTMPCLQELDVSHAFVSIAKPNGANALPHLHKINVYDSVTVETQDIQHLAQRAPNLQELQVSSYENRVTEAIIPALTQCQHLHSLKLGSIAITAPKLTLLAQTHHQQLTSLQLHFSREREGFDLDAFKVIPAFTQLQNLELERCSSATNTNLIHLRHLQELKHVQLYLCPADASGLSQISMPKLESIRIHKRYDLSLLSLKGYNSVQKMAVDFACNLQDSEIETYCRHNPQLLHFKLSAYHLTDKSLLAIGQYLPKLQVLKFAFAYQITSKGIQAFCQSGLNLQHLNLEYGTKLINSDIDQICKGFPDLKILNLYHCSGLNSSVMKSIATNLRQLEILDMRLHIGPKNPKKVYFKDVAALLQSNPKLKTIHINKYDVDNLELFKDVASRSRRIQLN